jgi:carbon-monoxide dehydrogenase small subunit
MKPLSFQVNGETRTELVEARMHLADLLRDRLHLTGTHLRCEQGVCGACTLLIDGEPARSCLTYAVLCENADITTIEGLEDDPVIVALRRAFTIEHGLQCGYCTPGMLVTARDIIMRLPDADEARVRLELAGNLCRCTGYVGIVRAIRRVLAERMTEAAAVPSIARKVGPVGARPAKSTGQTTAALTATTTANPEAASVQGETALGLGGRQPNFTITRALTIRRPPGEVWPALADLNAVIPCIPGAGITRLIGNDHVLAQIAVKLGPITARFNGEARVTRDDASQRGTIAGAGSDRATGSRAGAEVTYGLSPAEAGAATRIDIDVRAVLSGPLAQFGRSGIVDDLATRLTALFAGNLERLLTGGGAPDGESPAALQAGSLLRDVVWARVKALLDRIRGWR